MCFISVVLPIYNVEKYLEKCITSVYDNDSFEDFEVLLVDDGSTDSSGQICDEYARRYDNIYSFHKENGGLSDARNYGLMRAKGKYVFFLDSDDFLVKNALEIIAAKLKENKETDIVVFDAICTDEEGTKQINNDFEFVHKGLKENCLYSGEELLEKQLEFGFYHTTVWLGVYRRAFLVDNQLLFEKGLLHEDELWSPITTLTAQKTLYIEQKLYCYRIRNNSIMRNKQAKHEKNVKAYLHIYDHLADFYTEHISNPKLLADMMNDMCGRYLYVIFKWKFYQYPECFQKIDYQMLKKYSLTFKNKIRSRLVGVLFAIRRVRRG